jgi:hypothetical protein
VFGVSKSVGGGLLPVQFRFVVTSFSATDMNNPAGAASAYGTWAVSGIIPRQDRAYLDH